MSRVTHMSDNRVTELENKVIEIEKLLLAVIDHYEGSFPCGIEIPVQEYMAAMWEQDK